MKTTKKIIIILFLILIVVSTLVFIDLYRNSKKNAKTITNNSLIQQNTNANSETTVIKEPKTKTKETSDKVKEKTNYESVVDFSENNVGSAILGRPTDNSIAVNIIAIKGMTAFVEYGTTSDEYIKSSETKMSANGEPIEIEVTGLDENTDYYYRVNYKTSSDYIKGEEYSFTTARPKGTTFTFAVQGDSHPERNGKMFNPELYKQTMNNVLLDNPDFYFTIGDDFSIEKLIEKDTLSEELVDRVYLNQRNYLGIIGSSIPLFLVNGNHEQAAKYLLDGTPNNPAILAANSRIKNYPLPEPNGFYSGDLEEVEFVGKLRDYYAFEWGDALFVTLDPYWHSDVPVDNVAGSDGEKRSDLWDVTLGDDQYEWFKKTLEESDAKYKFVFTHHVLGTGRGGIENVKLFEWGGYNQKGVYEFDSKRPTWEKPIHQIMTDNGVTIFFQGHDHIFAKQEADGIIYQSLPNPADDTYTAFNEERYKTGDTLPNSGHLRVTVSSEAVSVDYVRSFLPGDGNNGEIAYSYEVLG